jgi:hypothetical protein
MLRKNDDPKDFIKKTMKAFDKFLSYGNVSHSENPLVLNNLRPTFMNLEDDKQNGILTSKQLLLKRLNLNQHDRPERLLISKSFFDMNDNTAIKLHYDRAVKPRTQSSSSEDIVPDVAEIDPTA